MSNKVLDKNIYFEYLPNSANDWHYGDINAALQQPMKQQASDGSIMPRPILWFEWWLPRSCGTFGYTIWKFTNTFI